MHPSWFFSSKVLPAFCSFLSDEQICPSEVVESLHYQCSVAPFVWHLSTHHCLQAIQGLPAFALPAT